MSEELAVVHKVGLGQLALEVVDDGAAAGYFPRVLVIDQIS